VAQYFVCLPICLKGLKKTTEILKQYIRSKSRDFEPGISKIQSRNADQPAATFDIVTGI